MPEQTYTHVLVGGGLAAAAAVEGIRQRDPANSILLISRETDLPYDRPTLSKQLWTGAKKLEEITLHPRTFYDENKVTLMLGTEVVALDPATHQLRDNNANTIRYNKLLLATGGTPRKLPIPGGNLEAIHYFRSLDDYRKLRRDVTPGKRAVVIGGGFIGSELAASLSINGAAVTMIFPDRYLVSRVFPEPLGIALTDYYRSKGITLLTEDRPEAIEPRGNAFLVHTKNAQRVEADIVIAGVGIDPNIALAKTAGLNTSNGVIVDPFLQTSAPDVYAAGDIAFFPDPVFGPRRIEHWDNAVSQGKHAGLNMAGAHDPFTYMPFFFSDLFEFGYEAVGNIDSRLQTFADWQEINKTGVIYYLDQNRLRGAMMCNVWGKVDAARDLIRKNHPTRPEDLRGAIQ